jgi:hypothetical protein
MAIIDIYGQPLNSPEELREPQTSRAGSLPRPMSDYPVRGLIPLRPKQYPGPRLADRPSLR